MKRFLAMVMALLMAAGTAMACGCMPGATVRMTATQMCDMALDMSAEELEAVSVIAMGMEGECTTIKTALIRVVMRNHAALTERFGAQRMDALAEYIGHCCCEEGCGEGRQTVEAMPVQTPAPTQRPTARPTQRPQPTPRACQHQGGTHENRGTCTICGAVYQDHTTPGEWKSENSTWHYAYCSYPGCNARMASGRHVWDGVVYGTSASGLKKMYCTVCYQYSYIRIGSTQVTTTQEHDNGCCGCCNGRICEGECGCGCDEE